MPKYIRKKALKNAIECCTWYHINKNGELVEGASVEDEPLYKYSDIKKIIKGLPTRKFKDEQQIDDLATAIANGAYCRTCKHLGDEDCDCDVVFTGYEPKDESQTDCAWK